MPERKQSVTFTLQPRNIGLLKWYADQTERSRSAVLDAALMEMLTAKESSAHFHTRLLKRLGGMHND